MKTRNWAISRLSHSIRLPLVKLAGYMTYLFLERREGQLYTIKSAESLARRQNNTANTANPDRPITSLLLHPATSYTRLKPVYANKKMGWSTSTQEVPPLYLYSIPSACVSNLGVISTFDGNIIAESAEQFVSRNQNPDGFIQVSENRFIQERINGAKIFHGKCILLTNKHAENYGHFILECLPNVRLLSESEDLSDARIAIHKTVNAGLRRALFEALELSGVRKDRIIEFGGIGEVGIFEEVLYPSPLTGHPIWKSEVAIKYCERLAEKTIETSAKNLSPEFLYVSRSAGFKRRPTNEDEVIDTLASSGFNVVYPEKMSVQEQIVLFSRARIIVGILGAAMTNIVFSPQNAQVIMLTPDSISGHFFWDLSSLKKQGYYALFCKTIRQERGYGDADFYVDINNLNEALAAAQRMISN